MNDGGYGVVGNFVTYMILNDMGLEDSNMYREKLKEIDSSKYEGYLDYEEMVRNGQL